MVDRTATGAEAGRTREAGAKAPPTRYVRFVRVRYAIVVYRERREHFNRRNGWRWAWIAWSTHLYILDGWGERT